MSDIAQQTIDVRTSKSYNAFMTEARSRYGLWGSWLKQSIKNMDEGQDPVKIFHDSLDGAVTRNEFFVSPARLAMSRDAIDKAYQKADEAVSDGNKITAGVSRGQLLTPENASFVEEQLDKYANIIKAEIEILSQIIKNLKKYPTVAEFQNHLDAKKALTGEVQNDETLAAEGIAKKVSGLTEMHYILAAIAILIIYFMFFYK